MLGLLKKHFTKLKVFRFHIIQVKVISFSWLTKKVNFFHSSNIYKIQGFIFLVLQCFI